MKHIPMDQMRDRFVVVLANLKPSKLRGVESQAMVLCATSPDGSTVELVQPPVGSKVGERVLFEGHEGAAEDVLPPKKKIWEKVQLLSHMIPGHRPIPSLDRAMLSSRLMLTPPPSPLPTPPPP